MTEGPLARAGDLEHEFVTLTKIFSCLASHRTGQRPDVTIEVVRINLKIDTFPMSSTAPPSPYGFHLRCYKTALMQTLRAWLPRHPELAYKLRAVNLNPLKNGSLRPDASAVTLGIDQDGTIQPLPQTLPPALASQFMRQLYPQGICNQPLLVTGEDVGWLWNAAYQLPTQIAAAPGHRCPLFFLIRDIERFWVILHIQEWATLLMRHAVRLYGGDDAFEQFNASLTQEVMCPWPKFLINTDNALWPAKLPLDSVLDDARSVRKEKLRDVELQLRLIYDNRSPASTAQAFSSRKTAEYPGDHFAIHHVPAIFDARLAGRV